MVVYATLLSTLPQLYHRLTSIQIFTSHPTEREMLTGPDRLFSAGSGTVTLCGVASGVGRLPADARFPVFRSSSSSRVRRVEMLVLFFFSSRRSSA